MRLTLLIFLFLSANLSAQSPLTYFNVVHIDSSTSKDELFDRAKIWFVESYNNADAVIHMENKEKGIIIGKGLFNYTPSKNSYITKPLTGVIHYTFSVYFKDGRYKYYMTDFIHESRASLTPHSVGLMTQAKEIFTTKILNECWSEMKAETSRYSDFLAEDFKKSMIVQDEILNDDW